MKKLIVLLLLLFQMFGTGSCNIVPVSPGPSVQEDYVKAPVKREYTEDERVFIDRAYQKVIEKYPEVKKISRDLLLENYMAYAPNSKYEKSCVFIFCYGGIPAGHAWKYFLNNDSTEDVEYDGSIYAVPESYLGKKMSVSRMEGYQNELLKQIKAGVNKYGLKQETDDEKYLGATYYKEEDGHLVLSCEYIGYYDIADDTQSGCGIDHEHIFASVVVD